MGKKYDLPLKDTMTSSENTIDLPVHIVCNNEPKYNKSISLNIDYGKETKLSDVFHHIEHYISTSLCREHNGTQFSICGVSKKSFTNKTIMINDDCVRCSQHVQSQYDSISNYNKTDIVERGVHLLIQPQSHSQSQSQSQSQPPHTHNDGECCEVLHSADKPDRSISTSKSTSAAIRKPLQTLCINNSLIDTRQSAVDNAQSCKANEKSGSFGLRKNGRMRLDARLNILCSTVDVAFVCFEENMRHFRKKEQRYALELDRDYTKNVQSSINWAMREILIDWFYDLQIDMRLDNETLFAAVQYVDCYLSQFDITRVQLQLLGVTAILIASKTYEIIPQPISELIYLSNDQYKRKDIVLLERKLLKTLRWTTFQVTPYNYIKPWLLLLNIRRESKEKLIIDLLINTVSLSSYYLQNTLSVLVSAIIYLSAVVYMQNECALDPALFRTICPEISNTDSLRAIMRRVHELLLALIAKGTKHRDTSSIYRRFKNAKYIQKHYALSSEQMDIDEFPFQQNYAKFANHANANAN